jgi:GNAT superfamily N-acetyltransferase
LASGLLENYYHQLPPLHTPYNPPYLPELMNTSLQPWQRLALRHVPLLPAMQEREEEREYMSPALSLPERTERGAVTLVPLTAALALSETFLPLWQAAALPTNLFPAPDRAEVAFIWTWLTVFPWVGWVAIARDHPVGFLLLQPDLASQSRRAGGGRNPLWAWWLQWRSQRPVANGRLTYGAILPAWQGRGIEELFWQQTWHHAQQQAWQTLTVGPQVVRKGEQIMHNTILPSPLLDPDHTAIHQRYTIYASER